MELYSELGDNIALQYGGSEAHKKVSGGNGPGKQVRRNAAFVATSTLDSALILTQCSSADRLILSIKPLDLFACCVRKKQS